jgi:hypothetical protein
MKFLTLLMALNISAVFGSDISDPWHLIEQEPFKPEKQITSPDKSSTVTLYVSTLNMHETGELKPSYIKINTPSKTWWLSHEEPRDFYIRNIEFIDNQRILVENANLQASTTKLVYVDTKKIIELGGGSGRYIKDGKNKGLVLFSGAKSYFREGGAFWYSQLKDLEGNLVEILSVPGEQKNCIKLSKILNPSKKYPYLRQKLTDCVYVEQ